MNRRDLLRKSLGVAALVPLARVLIPEKKVVAAETKVATVPRSLWTPPPPPGVTEGWTDVRLDQPHDYGSGYITDGHGRWLLNYDWRISHSVPKEEWGDSPLFISWSPARETCQGPKTHGIGRYNAMCFGSHKLAYTTALAIPGAIPCAMHYGVVTRLRSV